MLHTFSAVVERDGHMYIAYCPGLRLRALGSTITEARNKLADALEVFLETASPAEVKRRQEYYLTQIEIAGPEPAASVYTRAPEVLSAARHAPVASSPVTLPVARSGNG